MISSNVKEIMLYETKLKLWVVLVLRRGAICTWQKRNEIKMLCYYPKIKDLSHVTFNLARLREHASYDDAPVVGEAQARRAATRKKQKPPSARAKVAKETTIWKSTLKSLNLSESAIES